MAKKEKEEEISQEIAPVSEGEEEGKKPKSSKIKKIILFVVLPLVLIILIAVGVMLSGIFSSKPHPEEKETSDIPVEIEVKEDTGESFFYEIPEVLVNLNSDGKRSTFLKMTVNLEVGKKEDFVHLDKVLPKVLDNFQVYLRELRPEDLRGSEGIYRLREELLLRVNLASRPVVVKDVLFLNILTQ